MKTRPILTLTFLLASLSSQAAVIDGTKDVGATLRSTQTIETGFGDNGSEWNAAYGDIGGGVLDLMFTGNLEANFNKLEIFIDSVAGGSNVFPATPGNDGSGIMAGMTFDTAFTPEYHLIIRRGNAGTDLFDLDISILGTATFDSYGDIGAGTNDMLSVSTGTGTVNASPIAVGFNNSNVAGIGGTAGNAADQTAAQAVTTGLELSIALADIGSPTGPVNVMLLQNNDNHDFLSNQTLGGLPVGTGNLGNPASGVDFSALSGDQFFTVPEPTSAVLGMLGLLAILRRRR